MSDNQRQHEEYWGQCWAVPLGQHLAAEVHPTRPHDDPPDIDFRIERPDGTVVTSWGEVTGTYYDAQEAKLLWSRESGNSDRLYFEPDAIIGARARNRLQRKRDKYEGLVRRRGCGHLLVLLHSRLTTRSTRVAAEESMLALLETESHRAFDPFATVWLGYRLGIALLADQEDPQYAFRDASDGEGFNFLKCIWAKPGL